MANVEQQTDNMDLRRLQDELQRALKLIEQNSMAATDSVLEDTQGLRNTKSLLERCEQVVHQSSNTKPILRIIHHFACSGGTLISKCLAAQPNVFLLSELNPYSTLHLGNYKAKFLPTDIIGQARYARVPDMDLLATDIFAKSIIMTEKHVRERGGRLVIRAHSHSDYCVGAYTVKSESLSAILSEFFHIEQIVTVRDPIDSFSSLVNNGWVHFSPATFDEYCRRLLIFLKQFGPDQVFSYEAFTTDPKTQMRLMLEKLKLPLNEEFDSYFEIFNVSGDSGRSSSVISPRDRKPIVKEFELEISNSEHYRSFRTSQYNLNGI